MEFKGISLVMSILLALLFIELSNLKLFCGFLLARNISVMFAIASKIAVSRTRGLNLRVITRYHYGTIRIADS